ncbi:hypothetical protein IX307_001404 [Bacteroides pyogenes]|uniref:DUF1351 domain-containing protein n=1 Tax=Bacteroides pyogenes TaxID=310300 RepID=A0A5D3EHG2_9BACE|nr:hypothetical protein [Bacteroides pyogenes]MBR8720172.1 hypothetical protein [Bacteroides pyogenes]MBR8787083.1 hypothetical protein [Bacteroides pyogenes]MBR8792549.1 hypothetical protein [Bacteroides pyogenes]TYK35572.1 hypothetical protein FNJ60_00205 [Bacteroides pyogenes]
MATTDLIKVDEVKKLFTSFPEIVGRNSDSVKNCNMAGQAILDTIEGEGMSEELDQKAALYLKKVGVTVKNMNDRRAPLTQIFDKIRSFFTSQEKAIDPKDPNTVPGQITAKRNEYAQWKYEQEQKRRQEAERRAALDREKSSYRQSIEDMLLEYFNNYLKAKVDEIQGIFSRLTLQNYDREVIGITVFQTDYPKAHFDKFSGECATYYISSDEKREVRQAALQGKYELFASQMKTELSRIRQDIIDRLPSKKKELMEMEVLRQRDAEAAAKAEAERKQREAAEAAKRMEELRRQEEAAKQANAMKAQQDAMGSLFDATAATVAAPPTNARVKEKIVVLHQQGFLEIFQMWWINEGQTLSIEELGKVFKKMITYCEKQANSKDQSHINSQYIRYEADVKAK